MAGYHNAGATSMAAGSWTGDNFGTANYALVVPGGVNGQNIFDDMAQGTTAGRSLRIARPFSGKIGQKDSPLVLKLTDGSAAQKRSDNTEAFLLYEAALGEMHASADTGIDNLFVNGNGLFNVVGGPWGWMHLNSGGLLTQAAAQFNYLQVTGGNGSIKAYSGGGALPTTIDIWDGTITLERYMLAVTGAINVYGGKLILNVPPGTAVPIINLHGGRFEHISGDVTAFTHNNGVHDYSSMNKLSTIATCVRRPLARAVGVRSSNMLTITNDYTSQFPEFKAA